MSVKLDAELICCKLAWPLSLAHRCGFLAWKTLRIRLVVILALIAGAAGIGIYVLNIVFSDGLKFRQNDAAYFIVATSKTVRNFPRFTAAVRPVDFAYSARDGTAPGQIVMTYSSSDVVADLEGKHRFYCQRQGFPIVPKDRLLSAARLGCDAPDYRIEIDFSRRNNATLVTIVFLER